MRISLTVAEIDALLHAINSSDVMDEPDDYEAEEVAAMKQAKRKLLRAINHPRPPTGESVTR